MTLLRDGRVHAYLYVRCELTPAMGPPDCSPLTADRILTELRACD